jgi:flagellar motility protein MotE (MotC chaperone)
MKKTIFLLLLMSSSGLAAPSWSPSPSSSPSPISSPTALNKVITPAEAAQLLADFQSRQVEEIAALKRGNEAEMRTLEASQKARYKDWISQERTTRHKYFKEHPDLKRAEKRAYIADYRMREKNFLQIQGEERLKRKAAQDLRMDAIQSDQKAHLKEFKSYLSHGERPPAWVSGD